MPKEKPSEGLQPLRVVWKTVYSASCQILKLSLTTFFHGANLAHQEPRVNNFFVAIAKFLRYPFHRWNQPAKNMNIPRFQGPYLPPIFSAAIIAGGHLFVNRTRDKYQRIIGYVAKFEFDRGAVKYRTEPMETPEKAVEEMCRMLEKIAAKNAAKR